jgi:hypothetical protein
VGLQAGNNTHQAIAGAAAMLHALDDIRQNVPKLQVHKVLQTGWHKGTDVELGLRLRVPLLLPGGACVRALCLLLLLLLAPVSIHNNLLLLAV